MGSKLLWLLLSTLFRLNVVHVKAALSTLSGSRKWLEFHLELAAAAAAVSLSTQLAFHSKPLSAFGMPTGFSTSAHIHNGGRCLMSRERTSGTTIWYATSAHNSSNYMPLPLTPITGRNGARQVGSGQRAHDCVRAYKQPASGKGRQPLSACARGSAIYLW